MSDIQLPLPPLSPGEIPLPPGWFSSIWYSVRRLFAMRRQFATDREMQLTDEVRRLNHELHDRDNTIFHLKTQVAINESEIAILRRERILMVEVHETDRARIAADQAAYVRAAAVQDILRERGQ